MEISFVIFDTVVKTNQMSFSAALIWDYALTDMFFYQSECKNCCLYMIYSAKSRCKPNLESTFKDGFSPDLGGILSMRMQVILDSLFARPGSAPILGGKKGEFRDLTMQFLP